MLRKRFMLLGLVLGGTAFFLTLNFLPPKELQKADPETILKTKIPSGATFVELARWLGVATDTAATVLETAKSKYNLAKIISGRELALTFNSFSGQLKRLVYNIDSEERLIVDVGEEAKLEKIPYEVREREAEGVVSSSLYEAMTGAGYDERLVLALAEMFAWQVDFVADTREGDSFKVIYEERYLDGEYVMPGKILAARYTNDGETFYGYWFSSDGSTALTTSKTKAAYYDENGKSLQKEFLKAPLQYRYISSGFSYARLNPVTRKVAPHRGIDYAAPAGTPAVSIGDGTIVQAGWNGPYGISVLVRHNDTYSSRYGHFSRLAKGIKVGAKVHQGQVVGYVGSTGESTGPHLHYEIHKFGALVNPFKLNIPPGKPVDEKDRLAFSQIISIFRERLVE